MIKEYIASKYFSHQEVLKELEDKKLLLLKTRDKTQKKEIKNICKELVNEDPHFAYMYLDATDISDKNDITDAWKEKNQVVDPAVFKSLQLEPGIPSIEFLPVFTWSLYIPFKLKKPYISRDDTNFYITENPIKKEWVFKLPYVAPSQWKGALQATFVRCLADRYSTENIDKESFFVQERLQLFRLFGNEHGVELDDKRFETYLDKVGNEESAVKYREAVKKISESGFVSGCLYFYPTYFNNIGCEIINPHSRKNGSGERPISIESVPAGTSGIFTLLYVPLWTGNGIEDTHRLSLEDLKVTIEAIRLMFTEYGFGAKTSSGFGVVEEDVREGRIQILADSSMFSYGVEEKSLEIPSIYLKYFDEQRKLQPQFLDENGNFLSNSIYKQGNHCGGTLNEYKKFRIWYKENESKLISLNSDNEETSEGITEICFDSFTNLVSEVTKLSCKTGTLNR